MNKYKKLLLLLGLLGIAAAFVYFGPKFKKSAPESQVVTQELKTTLSFDTARFVGKSALEATKSFAKVEESGTGQNAFVTSINGKSADSKKREFWELVINGQSSQVGSGNYIIQKGDSILWKLSTY